MIKVVKNVDHDTPSLGMVNDVTVLRLKRNLTLLEGTMGSGLRFQTTYMSAFAKNSGLFLFWGVLLAILGVVAIGAATFTTMLSVVILGFLIFFSGCVMLADTFTFWRGKASSFLIHLLMALLYTIVGLVLISNPVEGSISLTFVIGIFFVFAGIYRLLFSSLIQMPRWGWIFVNGLITLALGVLILNSWPESSMWIIGLFVGIDLFFVGWFYIMAALAARSLR
jgi:uncharacterized membrane protein HdeD (DUF308 family)